MMTEVISRDRPYSQELISLTADEVLQLVKDKDAPSAVVAKRVRYTYCNTFVHKM